MLNKAPDTLLRGGEKEREKYFRLPFHSDSPSHWNSAQGVDVLVSAPRGASSPPGRREPSPENGEKKLYKGG